MSPSSLRMTMSRGGAWSAARRTSQPKAKVSTNTPATTASQMRR
jgi:hypothetical protein